MRKEACPEGIGLKKLGGQVPDLPQDRGGWHLGPDFQRHHMHIVGASFYRQLHALHTAFVSSGPSSICALWIGTGWFG